MRRFALSTRKGWADGGWRSGGAQWILGRDSGPGGGVNADDEDRKQNRLC